MQKKLFIILFIFFIVAGMNASDSVKYMTLKEVKKTALEFNTNIKNAKLDVRIARKKIWETTAIGLPQISAKVEYQDIPNIPTTLIPAKMFDRNAEDGKFLEMKFGTQHNAGLSLIVNQLIFKGSYIVGLQASRIYLKLSEDILKKSELDIKELVTNTYNLIILAEESEKIIKESIKNMEKIFYETNELFKSGFIESTDVDQLKLTITELKNNLSSVIRQKKISYKLLKYQMGIPLDKNIRVSDSLNTIIESLNTKDLILKNFKVENYIEYMMLDTKEISKKLLLKNEKSEFLPTISAYFLQKSSAMRDEFNFFRSNDDKWFSSTVIGLNIEIPIFDSGLKIARVGQANLELIKARNEKKQAREGLEVEWERSKSSFIDEWNKLKNTKESVLLAEKVYNNNEIKFKAGLVSSLQLIQAHNQYLNAKSNYINNVVLLLNAKTKIEKYLDKL